MPFESVNIFINQFDTSVNKGIDGVLKNKISDHKAQWHQNKEKIPRSGKQFKVRERNKGNNKKRGQNSSANHGNLLWSKIFDAAIIPVCSQSP